MHIAIIMSSAMIGGSELQFSRLASEFRDRGHRVSMLLLRASGELEPWLQSRNIDVFTYSFNPRKSPWQTLVSLARFMRQLRSLQADVVLAVLPRSISITLPLARLLTPQSVRIAGIRGFIPKTHWVAARAFTFALNQAAIVICNARHLADELAKDFQVPPTRLRVIANGVDQQAENRELNWPPRHAIVVANFHTYKGHIDLVRALRHVVQPLTFRFCGQGDLGESLRLEAVKLGVADRISFVGNADMEAEFRRADIGVHPSHSEGLSNAILEELAHGLPVVACDVGGNPELIRDGYNGFLVPPESPRDLAAAINQLVSDKATFSQMTGNALESVKPYAWDAAVSRVLEELEQALGERRRLNS